MNKMALSNKDLHPDIIIEILLRLPVKSLQKFRSVCRKWNALIKSTDFISMHLNYSTAASNNHLVLIKRNLGEEKNYTNMMSFHSDDDSLTIVSSELQIPYFNFDIFMEVLGPCNGIICLTNYKTFFFCNPATREFRLLPSTSCDGAIPPLCQTMGIGFGFDSSFISDLKLVRITLHSHKEDGLYHQENRADIYSLRSRSWRQLDGVFPLLRHSPWRQLDGVFPQLKHSPCFALFYNDACHWPAVSETDKKKIIFSFSLSSEKFTEIDLPSNITDLGEKEMRLEVSNGSLALIAYTDPQLKVEEQNIEIWIMKVYGVSESWIKLFNIGPLSGIRRPLSLMKNDVLLLENIEGQLISYSIDKQNTSTFEIYGSYASLRTVVYKESLVSIK